VDDLSRIRIEDTYGHRPLLVKEGILNIKEENFA
jgi:hypothetical protein